MIEFNCHNFERLTSAQQKALCTMIQLAFEHFSKHPEGPDSRASRCPLQAVVQPSDSEAVNREAGQMKRTVQPRVGEPAKSRRGIPMREALRILLKEMNGGEPARLNPNFQAGGTL